MFIVIYLLNENKFKLMFLKHFIIFAIIFICLIKRRIVMKINRTFLVIIVNV